MGNGEMGEEQKGIKGQEKNTYPTVLLVHVMGFLEIVHGGFVFFFGETGFAAPDEGFVVVRVEGEGFVTPVEGGCMLFGLYNGCRDR